MANIPPGFRQAGAGVQTILGDQVAPAVKFALTEWYAKGRQPYEIRLEVLPAVNQLNLEAKQAILRQNLMDTFGSSTPQLLKFQEGRLTIPDNILSGTLEEAELISSECSRCLEAFNEVCRFTVPEEECLKEEFWHNDKDRKRFAAWLAEKHFSLSDLKDETSDELLEALQKLKQCADLKSSLLRTLTNANQLLEEHRGLDVMRQLHEEPQIDEVRAAFAKFGAGPVLDTYRQFCQDYPSRLLNTEFSMLTERFEALSDVSNSDAEQAFTDLETFFSNALVGWQKIPALAECLSSKNAPQLSDLTAKFVQRRSRIWTEKLEELAGAKEYFNFAAFFSSCRSLLVPDAQENYACYALGGQGEHLKLLQDRLLQAYCRLLPNLLSSLYSLADDAANISGKPGASLVLCQLFDKLANLSGDSPLMNEQALLCERVKVLQAANLDLVCRKYFMRRLAIGDFSSSQPALGMTYARDLAHTLEAQLKSLQLEPYITITTEDQQKLPDDDAIVGGVLADFDGSEQLTRESTRSVIIRSAVRSMVNPDFVHAPAPGEADSRINAPVIFLQDEYEHVIHTRTTERQVHVRIFFTVRLGLSSKLIELNEFYPRVFLEEQCHPQQDVRLLNTCSAFREDALQPAGDLPELQTDRLWSTGEMLDYARKDSLQALALKVLLVYRNYVLKQALEAFDSSDTSPLEAAEQFGRFICAQKTFRNITKDDYLAVLPASEASCSEADWQAFTSQQQEFSRLAETVSEDACRLADKYIRQLRQNKSSSQSVQDAALMF